MRADKGVTRSLLPEKKSLYPKVLSWLGDGMYRYNHTYVWVQMYSGASLLTLTDYADLHLGSS
jgi:hypothetical protein